MLELGWPSLVKLMHSSTSKLLVSIISSHLVGPNCCVFLKKRQSLAHLHLRNWMSIQIAKHIKLARDGSMSPAKEDNRTIFMVSILHHCRMHSTEGSLRPNCWHLSRLMGTLNMWCLERIFSTYQRKVKYYKRIRKWNWTPLLSSFGCGNTSWMRIRLTDKDMW